MPYRVRKQECEQADGSFGSHVVQKRSGDGWETVSCHTSESDAGAAMRIREDAEKSAPVESDTIIAPGGQIKAVGERLAGYLVRFSSPDAPDLEGDFFTPETDFGPFQKSVVLYSHGMDEALKRRVLDDNASLKLDDAGVWIEARLEERDNYERMIRELAEQGKLGWSSGTAAHLVEREEGKSASRITRWPLGLDASVTTMPAEPRNRVVPLKSWRLPMSLSAEQEVLTRAMKATNELISQVGQRKLRRQIDQLNHQLEGIGRWK